MKIILSSYWENHNRFVFDDLLQKDEENDHFRQKTNGIPEVQCLLKALFLTVRTLPDGIQRHYSLAKPIS